MFRLTRNGGKLNLINRTAKLIGLNRLLRIASPLRPTMIRRVERDRFRAVRVTIWRSLKFQPALP
jgi:hypothetical protein